MVQEVCNPAYITQTMTLNPQCAMLQHRSSIALSFEGLLIAVGFEWASELLETLSRNLKLHVLGTAYCADSP